MLGSVFSGSAPFAGAPGLLSAPSILVVEDEALATMMLEAMLAEVGCEIAAVAATVAEALAGIGACERISAAILDVNLNGEKVFPVANALLRRDIPFVFSTGYGPADLARRYPRAGLLFKPYDLDDLSQALDDLEVGPF